MIAASVDESRANIVRDYAIWIVVLLAIAASISGITNGFALDDIHIIVQNGRVHSLSNATAIFKQSYWPADMGGALYRPLTSLAFVIQWVVGSGSPFPFHVVNIALYAAVSVAVYKLARELVRWEAALLAAALFAVHPVHVEAVANVVGQAELWAALFAIPAVTCFIRARRSREHLSPRDIVVITLLFATALMFKEHVVVLPAVLLAAEFLMIERQLTASRHLREVAVLVASMTFAAILFIVVRTSVLGDIAGAGVSPIFAGTTYSARVFTMLLVIMEWVRLFVWPSHLASDYAPMVSVATSFGAAMLPGILVLAGLGGVAFAVRKSKPSATFALAFAGIALLIPSNLLVMTGFVIAERALFLPSVGIVLTVAIAAEALVENSKEANPRTLSYALAAIAVILSLGVAKSTSRNGAWRDNAALIEQNVQDLPMSWQAHMMMAELHSERGHGRDALQETEVAVRLGSTNDFRLLAFAADMYQMHGRCDRAARYYEQSLAIQPDQPQVRTNAAICAAHSRVSANVR